MDTSKMKSKRRVLTALVAIVIALALGEVLSRLLLPRPGLLDAGSSNLVVPHPTRTFTLAPNISVTIHDGDDS